MKNRYAADTDVSISRSRSEIEQVLRRFGATGFVYGWQGTSAAIMFELHDRRVKFVLPLPDGTEERFQRTPTGRTRKKQAIVEQAVEQEQRSRWRALLLALKARLQSIEDGIESFEDAFLSHVVLPNGKTIGETISPQIAQTYKTGKMPPLLGAA